jgi:choline dehydrogenase-like flavoprotein
VTLLLHAQHLLTSVKLLVCNLTSLIQVAARRKACVRQERVMRREQLAEDAIVSAKTEAAEGVVTAAHRLTHTNWGPQVLLFSLNMQSDYICHDKFTSNLHCIEAHSYCNTLSTLFKY